MRLHFLLQQVRKLQQILGFAWLVSLIELVESNVSVSDCVLVFILGLLAHQDGPLGVAVSSSQFRTKIGFPEEASLLFMHDDSERDEDCVTVNDGIDDTHSAITMTTERKEVRVMAAMRPGLPSTAMRRQEQV